MNAIKFWISRQMLFSEDIYLLYDGLAHSLSFPVAFTLVVRIRLSILFLSDDLLILRMPQFVESMPIENSVPVPKPMIYCVDWHLAMALGERYGPVIELIDWYYPVEE